MHLTSFAADKSDITVIKTLDQFDSAEDNEQLAIDIKNYAFYPFLQQELPSLTSKQLNNITWDYIKSDNNEILFRLILAKSVLFEKTEIVSFFQKTVDNQIERQIKDLKRFDLAVKLATEVSEGLDEDNFDLFWDNLGKAFQERNTKECLKTLVEHRHAIFAMGGKKSFWSKQFYPQIKFYKFDMYVINFKFEDDETIQEQFVIAFDDEEQPKIYGFTWTASKKKSNKKKLKQINSNSKSARIDAMCI